MTYHLAQINIAHLIEPIDSPLLADFVADIDRINAIAEEFDGFIWRLKDESGNATSFQIFDTTNYIVNMSVWRDIESLRQYTYYSGHVEVYRKRVKWFHKMDTPHMAMWWIPADTLPTLEQAREKLDYLHEHGVTENAFLFKQPFPAPSD